MLERKSGEALWRQISEASREKPERSSADAIAAAARQIADTIGAKAIAAFTLSGSTALRESLYMYPLVESTHVLFLLLFKDRRATADQAVADAA